jgi:formate dehydrogenase major subunit
MPPACGGPGRSRLDCNVDIQESTVLTCDIRPGRGPYGRDLRTLVKDYRRRVGLS